MKWKQSQHAPCNFQNESTGAEPPLISLWILTITKVYEQLRWVLWKRLDRLFQSPQLNELLIFCFTSQCNRLFLWMMKLHCPIYLFWCVYCCPCTVKLFHEVTSIKQSPVLKGQYFLVLP